MWSDWRPAAEVLALSQAGAATLADAAGFARPARANRSPVAQRTGRRDLPRRSRHGRGRPHRSPRPEPSSVAVPGGPTSSRGWPWPRSRPDRELGRDAAGRGDRSRRRARRLLPTAPHGHLGRPDPRGGGVREGHRPRRSGPRGLLPDLLRLPAERARHGFHVEVLRATRTAAGGRPVREAARAGGKGPRGGRAGASGDNVRMTPSGPILADVRETVLSQPDHPGLAAGRPPAGRVAPVERSGRWRSTR